MSQTEGREEAGATVTVCLSHEQASRLARLVIARHLNDECDWLQWEDLPHLSESSFLRLCEAVEAEATLMLQTVRREDGWANVDTVFLLEQAQTGCTDSASGPMETPTQEPKEHE